MLFDEVWRRVLNLAHGFANDLDVADNRVLNLPVLLKGIEIWHGLEIACCAVDGFDNMLQMFQILFNTLRMLHRGCACRSTSLRNFGGNPFGVRTDTGTPNNSSASFFRPASVSRLVDRAGSTSKSRSLSFVSVPLTTDPKTRGCERP
jgi:hypothetical protein